ncbi:MAG: DUF3575 domain-containing protein [Mucinivorans sp.]
MTKRISLLIVIIMFTIAAQGQHVGIKTNLLYAGATFTPNLGVEVGLGRRTTLDIAAGYNPWNLNGSANSNKKMVHWLVQPEFRYWLCERFNGHFFGVHALGGQFNVGGHRLLGMIDPAYRYEGYGIGGGLTYGYQFVLGRSWNLELSVGAGYVRLNYDQYDCPTCGKKVGENKSHNYFGPTKAAVSLIFIIR